MTASTADPTTIRSRTVPAGRQTFARAVNAEWIKLRTLRSTWIISAIALVITVLIGGGVAVSSANDPMASSDAAGSILIGTTFGEIVVAVLGALAVTGEYSSGQIRSSLAAVPRRSRLLLAKALVLAAWSFLLGVVSIALTWAVSAPFMGDAAPSLTNAHQVGFIWGTGLGYAGIALMALGFGFLMRSTAGSITAVTVLMFVVDIPLGIMSSRWDWAANVSEMMPQTAVTSVVDPFAIQRSWADAGAGGFLTHTQAVLVFACWVLVPLLLGWAVFTRRDA